MNFMHLIVPLGILVTIWYVLRHPSDDGADVILVVFVTLAGIAIRF